MLHFSLPGRGRCHAAVDDDEEAMSWEALSRP
jgi:hypothetical protein